jgi:colicin import membrane protein
MPGNDNNTEKILAEIDTLLQNFQQTGGNGAVLDEINALISEYRGEETSLSEAEVMTLAQNGGAKKRATKAKGKKKTKSKSKGKKKKTKSKSKGKKKAASKSKGKKKTASKGKKKTASKSKGKKKTASKSKAKRGKAKSKSKSKGKKKAVAKRATASKRKTASKGKGKGKRAASKSKSRSKGRKMKREEGEKPKRKMNPFMANLTVLRRYIMDQIGAELKPMNVGAMSSAASKLLKLHDVDAEKAWKNFDKAKFMVDYNASKKAIEAKKAAKKAAKAAATH